MAGVPVLEEQWAIIRANHNIDQWHSFTVNGGTAVYRRWAYDVNLWFQWNSIANVWSLITAPDMKNVAILP